MSVDGSESELSRYLMEEEVISKSLLDSIDVTRYIDPDLFDLGLLVYHFLEDHGETALFEDTAAQLSGVVSESEFDDIFSTLEAPSMILLSGIVHDPGGFLASTSVYDPGCSVSDSTVYNPLGFLVSVHDPGV